MNDTELVEARPDLARRVVEPAIPPGVRMTLEELILRVLVVAAGIVLGAIFAFFAALFTGLIPIC